ncbi:MAG: DUF523 domain-containing protein [Firmicutes bacterium HGW-Firmicutes-15]|nr:MAG: DUF523 domain-containing protein [Firmicutes bacterium HGW-Firmicutes-15]
MKLISACLCGINCKYNGGNNMNPYYWALLRQGGFIPICPEQLGGLPTPRTASEVVGGTGEDVINGNAQVFTRDGQDLTNSFLKGAQETLRIAIQTGIDGAILQSRSPSCGHGKIYDGSFTGNLIDGNGVTVALLKKNDIKIWNDQDYLREKGVCISIESS